MRSKQHIPILFCALACLVLAALSAYGQQEKKIIIVPGDINKPYDIIDCVAFFKGVEVEFTLFGSKLEASYNRTLEVAFKDLEKLATKAGADAVINMQLQFVVLPGPKGNISGLLVFGTLVKFKTDN